jgi:hypothetical protein
MAASASAATNCLARPEVGLAARPEVGLAARPEVGLAARPEVGLAARPEVGLATRKWGAVDQGCTAAGLSQARDRFLSRKLTCTSVTSPLPLPFPCEKQGRAVVQKSFALLKQDSYPVAQSALSF